MTKARRFLQRHRRAFPTGNADHGTYSIESLIWVPFVFFFFLAIVQWSMVLFAQGLSNDAAISALQQARADGGTVQSGQAAGNDAIKASALGGLLQSPAVQVQKNATTVTASVQGKPVTFVPFFFDGLTINQTVSGPVERWVPR
ncbi:MAG: hypothetical protein L0G87_00475 [Renibacterium salmoninarum]|jgi:hypothetical protein|nr:hypothetical protein [Renibacterium salmoninarum]